MPRIVRFAAFLLCAAESLLSPGPVVAQPSPPIAALPTSDTALLGRFARGPFHLPLQVSASEFEAVFGSPNVVAWPAEMQARQFFANGGRSLHVVRIAAAGPLADALTGSVGLTGLQALAPIRNLRLLLAPELSSLPPNDFAPTFARFRAFLEPRRIFFILDPPPGLTAANDAVNWVESFVPKDASFCALYFPFLRTSVGSAMVTVGGCGAMAGIYSKVDETRGIWVSPAGTSWPLQAQGLSGALNSTDLDQLNTHNISALRELSGIGVVPWGARALDRVNGDNRYIPLVRTRAWAAASIERGLAFTALEANDAVLWSRIRASVGTFLHSLYQQGALLGVTPAEAYFARCDAATTTQADIAAHRVKVQYGMALLRPAEFDVTLLTAATYDPGRAPSLLEIQAGQWKDELFLSHPMEAGFNYVLQRNPGLQPGAWTEAIPSVPGDGAWRRMQLPVNERQQSYRLRVVPGR